MHAAAANGDFVTPAVVSAAEADYERNLANAVELFYVLCNDPQHGAHNKVLFEHWARKHVALATKAAQNLQPIWSQPTSKPVRFADSFEAGKVRLKKIASEIGIDLPAEIS
jgi:propane monooxygenase small subunit